MAESYSVKARLSATDSGFISTLKNALGATDSLASKLKSGFSFGILTGMGQKAFSSLTSGVSGLISEINSSNAAWKTFEGNMSILGKGTKEIDGVKKELQSFAEQTIYSSSDMAQTYAQLAAVGTKNTTKLVKGFGDLAAAAENPQQAMKTLSQQATQMAAKPKVAWQDFKLMLEQTPAGLSAVAKEMGMTTSELVRAVQEGEVSTNKFFDAIQKVGTSDGFTKLATQYKTVGQAMDGLKETVGNKLTPVFDILSQTGIDAISGIIDKLSEMDFQAVANKVSGFITKLKRLYKLIKSSGAFKTFSDAVSDVKFAISEVTSTIFENTGGLQGLSKGISTVIKMISKGISKVGSFIGMFGRLYNVVRETGAFTAISDAIKDVKNALVHVINAAKEFAPTMKQVGTAIGDVIKWISQAISWIANFISSLDTKTIEIATKVILGLVVGFKAMKVVKTIAPGLVNIAKGLGNIVTTAGKGLASKLFGIGTASKSAGSAARVSGIQMLNAAKSFALMGVAVLAIAAGFALLAQSAIALAGAGGGAIAVMGGLVVALVGLGIGMAALLKTLAPMSGQLMPVALAFLALGGAVVLISVGFALLAQSAIALAAAGWPAIAVMGGLVAVIALLAVGAALLGTALTAGALGFIAFGAAIILCGVGAVLAGVALQMIVAVLPSLIDYGLQGAVSILALGGALLVFGAGALIAGAGALVLGAGLLVVSAAVLVIAAGFMLLATATTIAGTGLLMVAQALPMLAENGAQGALALIALGAAFLVFGAGATVAGAGCIVLAAGLIAIGAAIIVIGAGILTMSLGATAAAGAIALLNLVLPTLAATSTSILPALAALGLGLVAFGAGASVGGAGALVLGAGLLVCSAAVLVLCAGILVLSAAVLALSAGALLSAAALDLLSLALPTLGTYGTSGAEAIAALGAALLEFAAGALAAGASALVGAAGTATFGAAMLVASAGTLVMAAALLAVTGEMVSISRNAATAEKSLENMKKSVDIVEGGLKTIERVAKEAMSKLLSAFNNTEDKLIISGKKLANGFVKSIKSGLMNAKLVAVLTVDLITTALKAGYNSIYNAGAYIGKGLANGMKSCLSTIRSAAAQMAAAADKAVRAKAKIKSPSRVASKLGAYWGEGFASGLSDMAHNVKVAAQDLASIPAVTTPDMAYTYSGELSSDYDYYRNAEYTIIVPVEIDGKEVARTTAPYTEAELNKRQKRDDRKKGRL